MSSSLRWTARPQSPGCGEDGGEISCRGLRCPTRGKLVEPGGCLWRTEVPGAGLSASARGRLPRYLIPRPARVWPTLGLTVDLGASASALSLPKPPPYLFLAARPPAVPCSPTGTTSSLPCVLPLPESPVPRLALGSSCGRQPRRSGPSGGGRSQEAFWTPPPLNCLRGEAGAGHSGTGDAHQPPAPAL